MLEGPLEASVFFSALVSRTAILRSDENDFPVAPPCTTGLVLAPDVSIPALPCLHYVEETAQVWAAEEISGTSGSNAAIKNKAYLLDHLCHTGYAITVMKYLQINMLFNNCMIKLGNFCDVTGVPN